jgi:hypothetical protein
MPVKLDVGHRTTKNIASQDLFENTLQKKKIKQCFLFRDHYPYRMIGMDA